MSVPRDANLRELVVAERAVASRCKKNFQTIQTIKSYCSNHNFACFCLCWWISSGIACIGDTECFTFNQNFWMFGESGKWYRNFPEKIPGNCWISKMQTIELKILEILGEKWSGKKTATRNTFRIFLQPDWQIDDIVFEQANHGTYSNPGTQLEAQNKDFCAVLQTDITGV